MAWQCHHYDGTASLKLLTMLTNPRFVALNEVSTICLQLQGGYEGGLDLLGQQRLQQAATERSKQLKLSVLAIEAQVRELHELPAAVDSEQNVLTGLVDHAASQSPLAGLVAGSNASILIDVLIEHEKKLEQKAIEVLEQSFSSSLSCPTTDQLEAIAVQAQVMQRCLKT